MIAWEFLIDLQDGSGQRDITSLVRDETVTRTRRLYNDLAPASWSLSFDINYDATIFPLLVSQKKEILLEVTRGGSAFFLGIVRPTFNIQSKNIGASGVGDTVSFEALDNGYKLDRVHGWNLQTDLLIAGKKVCDPADQANSAVHLILAEAGYTAGELGSLPTITKTVSLTIQSAVASVSRVPVYGPGDRGVIGTRIESVNPSEDREAYRPFLEQLFADHQYVFYFDAEGKIQSYLWGVLAGSVSTTGTMGQSDLNSYSLKRTDFVPDRVDVTYKTPRTLQGVVYTDSAVQTVASGATATFTGVIDKKKLVVSPTAYNFYDAILTVEGPSVPTVSKYPELESAVRSTRSFPVTIYNLALDTFRVTAFTVAADGTFSLTVENVAFGSLGTLTVKLKEIQANVNYYADAGTKSKYVTTQYNPVKIDSEYIFSDTDALDLADKVSQYKTAAQVKINAKSPTAYSLGQYLSLTEAINGISATKVRVVEITETAPLLADGSWIFYQYLLEPIEAITTTTTAAVTEPAGRARPTPEPDPVQAAAVKSLVIPPPTDGATITLPEKYVYWDKENQTLRVAGSLYLAGDSTVQGKITVGGSLSSTIYTSGSAGWSIDAAGNAEFYAIKLRGTIDAAGAVLGGYTITSTALYAGAGATRIQLDTTAGIWLGATTIGAAPFSVTLAGALAATSGQIGGWTLASDKLSSAGAGTARIELRQADKRVAVVNASNADQVVMGYLNGLPKNDGSGNWGVNDYGFWARTGDTLRIDGDAEYVDGDWLISGDASYIVENAGTPIVRMGSYSTEKGFFINETATGSSYRAKLTADNFRVGNDTAYIEFVGGTGALTIALANFYVSSTLTNILGTFQVSAEGPLTGLTKPVSITTDNPSTYGRINHADSIRLAVATVDKLTATSTGVGVGTTSPSGIFDVQKNQNATTQLFFRNTDTTGTGARLEANFIAGSNYLNILAIHSDAQYLQVPASSALYIQQGAGFPVTVSTGGNLLVGTTTDGGYKLTVNGTANITSNLFVGGYINISDSTEADPLGTGSIATAGGIYAAKKIYATGDIEAKADINQIDLADSAYLGIIRPRSHGTTGTGGIRYFYFTSGDSQNTAYDILNTYFSGDGAIPCMGHRANLGQVGVYLEKSGTTITMKSWDGNVMSTFADGSGTTLGTDHHIYLFST